MRSIIDIVGKKIDVLLQCGDKAQAMEVALGAAQQYPNLIELQHIVESVRSRRAKIAFFCGLDGVNFLRDIGMYAKGRFNVHFFEGSTPEEMYELMKWSDISWFEWCTDMATTASNLPKVCKTIVRLHRYEAYTHWPMEIKWENIDTLVTIGNDFVRNRLRSVVSGIENRTQIVEIPNGINLTKFKFAERPRGKNIAFICNLNMKKNPAFMLQCFNSLLSIDPEYKLFWAGKIQDVVVEQYMRYMVGELGLCNRVFFDGWHEDINIWLANKHFIVNSSIVEGHPVGVMEGMACGIKPVIHNFPGAKQFFPEEFLYNSTEEFCDKIISSDYEPRRYRRFIEDKYPLSGQLRQVNRLFVEFEKNSCSSMAQGAHVAAAGIGYG